ncbi:Shewanella-like protein phosphatase 2 [Linum perenne]
MVTMTRLPNEISLWVGLASPRNTTDGGSKTPTTPATEPSQAVSCELLPDLLSSFVDTFVDFSVSGGLFLPPSSPATADDSATTPSDGSLPSLRTRYPNPSRLIAIGDLHGDLEKTKQAFHLASLIDGSDRWSGGNTTVVQVGDVLDRGGDELKILYFLEKLKREAERSGGNLITMNGNHEIMNMEGDFRFATKLGLKEFEDWAFWYQSGVKMKKLCAGFPEPEDVFKGIPKTFPGVKKEAWSGIRARIAALRPAGPMSTKYLSKNLTVAIVGDSVFVHGGLLVHHVEYGLERMNKEVREWIAGQSQSSTPSFLKPAAPSYCKGRDAVVWLRKFSEEDCDCSALEHVLATIPGVKRMIMGHTIQEGGINGICGNSAIRIDVGMSRGCNNGLPEVLEIDGYSQVRILTSNTLYRKSSNTAIASLVVE